MPPSSRSFDSINVRETLSRLRSAIERRDIRQQEISERSGIEKSKLSRWLNEKTAWASIGSANYLKLLDFIDERNLFARPSYVRPEAADLADIAFHGMATFFGVEPDLIDFARENLVGYYVGYRYSYFAPPDILKGALEITYDQQTHALKTLEHFRVPAGALGAESAEINFIRQGYIWPTKLNMFVMISEKVGRKDFQVCYLNKSLLNAMTLDQELMHTIEGVLLDWQGPDFYMTKVFLQKLTKPLPLAEIGLKTEKEVVPSVLAKLKDRFRGPHYYLRTYK